MKILRVWVIAGVVAAGHSPWYGHAATAKHCAEVKARGAEKVASGPTYLGTTVSAAEVIPLVELQSGRKQRMVILFFHKDFLPNDAVLKDIESLTPEGLKLYSVDISRVRDPEGSLFRPLGLPIRGTPVLTYFQNGVPSRLMLFQVGQDLKSWQNHNEHAPYILEDYLGWLDQVDRPRG